LRSLRDGLRRVLASRGLELSGATTLARRRAFLETLEEWAIGDFDPPEGFPFSATGVVFSRDRALQLHALLQGWATNASGEADLVVLWTASDAEHESSYRELSNLWAGRVRFRREADFRADLLGEVESSRSTHLFFLTDDAMVLRPFEISLCLLPDPHRSVFSLTHGRALDWCFVARRPQRVPPLSEIDSERLAWNWKDGEEGTDWSYPLSVDGKFFSRQEMSLLLSRLPFRNPNTLEMALQIFLPIFARRKGVCFQDPVLVNVPCNTVQTECTNFDTGAHGVGELLLRWKAGDRIRCEDFANLSARQAETRPFSFAPRI
jgi:hypothetical protein